MNLTVIGSSSKGNCYVLHNHRESLILEAGCPFGLVRMALNFDTRIINGCLISHEHGDHALHAAEFLNAGIQVAASAGTIRAIRKPLQQYTKLEALRPAKFGRFEVIPFDVSHDAAEPLGFMIKHPDIGKLLFATDTMNLDFDFEDITTYMIEANYSREIVDARLLNRSINYKQVERTIMSHMSLETCAEFLTEQDLSETLRIILLHLSDGNSDAEGFKKHIQETTGVPLVEIADAGLITNISNKPF